MTKVRKTAIILTLPLLLLLVVSLTACGAVDYSSVAGEGSGLLYSAADMKSGLKEFLENNADRTSLVKELKPEDGDGEKKAAEWIADKLEELTGVRGKVESTGDRRVGQDVFSSQNVVYSVRSTSASGKRIVIGAHYDNLYADVMSASGRGYYTLGTKAEGAVGNGAAVAVMLEMCRYFGQNADRLNTNVDFVFYGMGCVDYGGAEAYRESLGESGRENTILAVTLDGLGGDELWMYFDETETAHGEFMMNIASTRGYGELVGEPPVMQADPSEALTDKLPYTPYALINESSLYFGSNNICTVTSGSDFTFLLGSEKWYGSSDAEYTSADTLATLEQNNRGYAEQMCIAADELTCSIFHPAFAEVCTQKNTSYAWLTGQIAAYVGGALLAAGLLVFTILMTRHLKKKYTDQGVRRNVKVAVFGMDYEDPKDGDVFVDTHPGGHDEEDPFGDDPFGGDDKGSGDNAKDK